MNMQDRNGAHIGISRGATHGITTDRTEGCDEVGNPVHGMIGQHAAHGEAAKIHTVTVNLVQRHHLLDDGLDEVDIAVATGFPGLTDTVGKDADELGGVADSLHAHLVVLELAVLHPVGILIVTVTEDEQRAVLA